MLNNEDYAKKHALPYAIRAFIPMLFEILPLNITYHIRHLLFPTHIEREMDLLPRLLKPAKGIAIDIGANRGTYTFVLSKLCGYTQVHAFEPLPGLCQYLRAKTKSYQGVKIHNMGLSDRDSELEIHIPLKNGLQAVGLATFQTLTELHESISVPVRTLDSFAFNGVSFIKIDVEGFESKVLAGSRETILRNKPVMLIEIEQQHLDRDDDHNKRTTVIDVINMVKAMGYQCYCYIEGRLVSVDEEPVRTSLLQNGNAKSQYIFNYLFLPLEAPLPCGKSGTL